MVQKISCPNFFINFLISKYRVLGALFIVSIDPYLKLNAMTLKKLLEKPADRCEG